MLYIFGGMLSAKTADTFRCGMLYVHCGNRIGCNGYDNRAGRLGA